MAEGLKKNERSGKEAYPDIYNLPHWSSPTRPRMSLYDRSAQFASYKALSGYEDMIAEEARLTDTKPELEEYELERLNQKLNLIADVIMNGRHPTLTFTVFLPDERKAGGAYVDVTDEVKRVNMALRTVVLMAAEGRGRINKTLDFDKIIAIKGELVDYMDDIVD